ncbi:MAG: hypothetical protein WAO47_07810 [Caldicoprobacterales bacterium]|nr:hypothetical protein [Clostridiales bacterium]
MSRGIIDTYVYDPHLSFGDRVSIFLLFVNVALFSMVLLFIESLILKYLWNITIPRIFKLPETTYWEAFRLILIAWILLAGFSLG